LNSPNVSPGYDNLFRKVTLFSTTKKLLAFSTLEVGTCSNRLSNKKQAILSDKQFIKIPYIHSYKRIRLQQNDKSNMGKIFSHDF